MGGDTAGSILVKGQMVREVLSEARAAAPALLAAPSGALAALLPDEAERR